MRRHGHSAFALIDAVVASIVLGLALVAVVGLTSNALAQQRRGERLQQAAMLADERLQLVLALGAEAYPSALGNKGACDAPFDEYSYEVEITPQSDLDPYHVRVTIEWEDAGRARSVDVETLIAPRRGDDPNFDRAPDTIVEREA